MTEIAENRQAFWFYYIEHILIFAHLKFSKFYRKTITKWTRRHDLELLRDILAGRPFEQPKGSRMIGLVRQKIVYNLNAKSSPRFILENIRAVWKRYCILEKKSTDLSVSKFTYQSTSKFRIAVCIEQISK